MKLLISQINYLLLPVVYLGDPSSKGYYRGHAAFTAPPDSTSADSMIQLHGAQVLIDYSGIFIRHLSYGHKSSLHFDNPYESRIKT